VAQQPTMRLAMLGLSAIITVSLLASPFVAIP
jgi:hypothetical protein